MWAGARLWLKVVLGFLFSITIILSCLTFALFGVTESDRVDIIVTEATGVGNRVVVFSGQLQPFIIHNAFWLSLAALGFFLIFLYFIDHSFRVFLAPGVLCLVLFVFINLTLVIVQNYIFAYTESYAAVYVMSSLARIKQAGFVVLALGVLLIGVSYWGTRLEKLPGQPKTGA